MTDIEAIQIILIYGVSLALAIWMAHVALKEGNKKGG